MMTDLCMSVLTVRIDMRIVHQKMYYIAWSCPTCTFQVSIYRVQCEMCLTYRPNDQYQSLLEIQSEIERMFTCHNNSVSQQIYM